MAIASWHDPGVLPTGAVPPPLRTWFELTARWSRPLTTHNSVLTPERVRTEDGKRVFCVENQSVWAWGMETADDDPAVYDRLNEAGEEWLPTGVPLSVFLLHLAVFEAIMGAREPAVACSVSSAERDAVLEPLRALDRLHYLTVIPGLTWDISRTAPIRPPSAALIPVLMRHRPDDTSAHRSGSRFSDGGKSVGRRGGRGPALR